MNLLLLIKKYYDVLNEKIVTHV